MDNKSRFLEKLNALVKEAKAQGSQMSAAEVEHFFIEEELTAEQLDLVFDYLLAQKVSVKGYVKAGTTQVELSEEEKAFLEEYVRELKMIPQEKSGERKLLFDKAVKGDKAAQNRLAEIYMGEIVDVAKVMNSPDVFIGDLIQEGNIGIVLGIGMLENTENAHDVIMGQVKESMRLLVEEQSESSVCDRKLVEKVAALDETIKTMTEELGRKPAIEELALEMGIEIEEISDILKLLGEDEEE